MPKINQEEYEVLKALDDKWKYLARNNMYGAKLEAHTSQPYKMTDSHWSNGDMTLELLGGEHLFQFIQWEDEEPYNIAELIEEYEKDYKGSWEHAIEFSGEVFGESEETEVKNIEELKSWFEDGKLYVGEYVKHKIDQLDEPEVLSSDWIDEHLFNLGDKYPWKEAVPVVDLQNLLVPKQEEVDRAYKAGYEKGKEHTFYKGYLEGLAEGERKTNKYFESIAEEPSYEQVQKYLSEHGMEVVENKPETVASVISNFYKSFEQFREVLSIEVEELEE